MRLAAIALLLGGVLSACVTAGPNEVTLASKDTRPAWIGLAGGELHEAPPNLQYVESRTGLRDLPLGIKETQQAALSGSIRALRTEVEKRVDARLSQAGIQLTRQRGELLTAIENATHETHGRYARIGDLFYEQLGGNTYRVNVLVTFPQDRMSELLQAVGRRLGTSRDPALKRAAKSL